MVAIYASRETAAKLRQSGNNNTAVELAALFTQTGFTPFGSEDTQSWVRQTLGRDTTASLQSNSTDLIKEYIAAGSGVAVLPCYVGEGDHRLCRIGDTRQASFAELWLLYHPRLRRLHRFRAFTEYLVEQFEHLRHLFEGDPNNPGVYLQQTNE